MGFADCHLKAKAEKPQYLQSQVLYDEAFLSLNENPNVHDNEKDAYEILMIELFFCGYFCSALQILKSKQAKTPFFCVFGNIFRS